MSQAKKSDFPASSSLKTYSVGDWLPIATRPVWVQSFVGWIKTFWISSTVQIKVMESPAWTVCVGYSTLLNFSVHPVYRLLLPKTAVVAHDAANRMFRILPRDTIVQWMICYVVMILDTVETSVVFLYRAIC